MNYGFLVGALALGALLGAIGLFAALRERDRARARISVAAAAVSVAATPVRAVRGIRGSIYGDVMTRALLLSDRPPSNHSASRPVAARELGAVYEGMWKWGTSVRPQLKS